MSKSSSRISLGSESIESVIYDLGQILDAAWPVCVEAQTETDQDDEAIGSNTSRPLAVAPKLS
jgi:hypothetical protein